MGEPGYSLDRCSKREDHTGEKRKKDKEVGGGTSTAERRATSVAVEKLFPDNTRAWLRERDGRKETLEKGGMCTHERLYPPLRGKKGKSLRRGEKRSDGLPGEQASLGEKNFTAISGNFPIFARKEDPWRPEMKQGRYGRQ